MFIKIAPSSGIPLYRQIIAQIRLAVATGRVRPGDKLPSIRDLSQTLEISPITVVKAYNELEHMGVVETRRGRGTFVTEGGTLLGYDDRVRAAAELLEETALDLADSGYYVYLVERGPSIGGVMSQLDKTFPTNDCAM